MIQHDFSPRSHMIKTQMNSGVFPPEIMLGCGMTEMSYIINQLEKAINIMMPLTVMTVPMQVQICMCGFLYTDVRKELSGCGITIVSRKGIDPSALAFSIVKLDVWVYVVNMFQESFFLCRIYDHTNVIYIFLPTSWRIFICFNGLGLQIYHVEFG